MRIYKTIIIDDDIDNVKLLSHYINNYCTNLEIVGTTQDLEGSILLIEDCEPELIFLDIIIGSDLGFDVLDLLPNIDFQVIFISAFEKYVFQSFKYQPINFLLKPISIKELKETVNRATEKIDLQISQDRNGFLAVPIGNTVRLIKFENILFCESQGNYTQIYIDKDNKLLISNSLGYYEKKLKKEGFIRIHKSYILNIAFIKSIHKSDKFYCELLNGKTLPISRRKQKDIMNLLKFIS